MPKKLSQQQSRYFDFKSKGCISDERIIPKKKCTFQSLRQTKKGSLKGFCYLKKQSSLVNLSKKYPDLSFTLVRLKRRKDVLLHISQYAGLV